MTELLVAAHGKDHAAAASAGEALAVGRDLRMQRPEGFGFLSRNEVFRRPVDQGPQS